ncbi:MAG: nucleotide exchange factor GrpE [Sumerlaeia bacterium]
MEVWSGAQSGAGDLLSQVAAIQRETRLLEERVEKLQSREQASSSGESRAIARQMLPVLDGMERILDLAQAEEEPTEEFLNWVKSIQAVHLRLCRIMDQLGLEPIQTVGKEVNFEYHDVVATVPSAEYSEGTIVEERQKGYMFQGRLLRDAKVVVALPS